MFNVMFNRPKLFWFGRPEDLRYAEDGEANAGDVKIRRAVAGRAGKGLLHLRTDGLRHIMSLHQ